MIKMGIIKNPHVSILPALVVDILGGCGLRLDSFGWQAHGGQFARSLVSPR